MSSSTAAAIAGSGSTTTPLAKRRRIEKASKTLSQPFRSPFKSPLTARTSRTGTHAAHMLMRKEATTTTTVAADNDDEDEDEETHLRRTLRTLDRDVAPLRAEIETLRQALRIERDATDADLQRLIDKWRGVGREAAEVLYGDVRERVNRIGGPAAWRDMQRKRHDQWGGPDAGGAFDGEKRRGNDNPGDDDDQEDCNDNDNDEPQQPTTATTATGKTDTEEEDEDVFTMATMLHILNVDLHLLGFDAEMQRWLD